MKFKGSNRMLSSLLLFAAGMGAALAQSAETSTTQPQSPVAVVSDAGVAALLPSMLEPVAAAGLYNGTLVRNQPLAAVFEAETIQIKGDGTRLVTRLTTRLFRDSEGRVRREQAIPSSGVSSITIYDPVGGFSYSVNSTLRTAQRYRLSAQAQGALLNNSTPSSIEVLKGGDAQTGGTARYRLDPPSVELLGSRQLGGVEATGRRLKFCIPAGALGNSSEVESVFETWMASDLQIMLEASVKNPSSGEYNLRLISLTRAEQPASLFSVPADFVVREMGAVRTDLPPPRN